MRRISADVNWGENMDRGRIKGGKCKRKKKFEGEIEVQKKNAYRSSGICSRCLFPANKG
jgi:hypothetical protein